MESRKAFDLVIRGGTVYDGTGSPGVVADVAVTGDRIVGVGKVAERGARELDAAGLAVTPGFIDVHSHDDFAVLLEPEMPFKVMQGVTTDVVGNCGSGVVPFEAGLIRFRRMHPGADPKPWDGFGGYLERVDEARPSLNVAVLMGHGSLRRGAMGLEQRRPTGDELDRMKRWSVRAWRRVRSGSRRGSSTSRDDTPRPTRSSPSRASSVAPPADSTRRTCGTRRMGCSTPCARQSPLASKPGFRSRSPITRRAGAGTGAACATRSR